MAYSNVRILMLMIGNNTAEINLKSVCITDPRIIIAASPLSCWWSKPKGHCLCCCA